MIGITGLRPLLTGGVPPTTMTAGATGDRAMAAKEEEEEEAVVTAVAWVVGKEDAGVGRP